MAAQPASHSAASPGRGPGRYTGQRRRRGLTERAANTGSADLQTMGSQVRMAVSYRRLASVARLAAATHSRNRWLSSCACAARAVYPVECGPAEVGGSVHRAASAPPMRKRLRPAPRQWAAASAAARGTPHTRL
eukprot:scaffold71881_cov64-Phaeocystis_antarctica.AAC.3